VKFGHVTFFWNGNRSGYFDETKEEYVEIPSDSGITFNVAPKMKALEIAEKARDALLSGKFDQVNDSEISNRRVFQFSHCLLYCCYRYVSTCQMVTWWVTLVILRPQLLLARQLMKLLR
jgi:hypothetical protein